MSEKDKSFDSKFMKGSNLGLSGIMKTKQLIQSHQRSIMSGIRGGQNQNQTKYLKIRVQDTLNAQKNLQKQLQKLLGETFGQYYSYKTFSDKSELLKEEINQQDIFYIFLKEQLSTWGQKFAKQQRQQSNDKKSIFIVQYLRKHKYDQKQSERQKLLQKNRRDPTEKYVYYINSDQNHLQFIQNRLIPDIEGKVKNKLRREGDRVKTWAIANKYKEKNKNRERLYIYIQDSLMNKLTPLYKRFKRKSGFKWTQIIKFSNFSDIMQNVKKRQEDFVAEEQLKSAISMSKVLLPSLSGIKSMSNLNGMSMLSGTKSVKNIIHQKTQLNLRNVDKNIIIHTKDFYQKQKTYQYVMSQKDSNWQRLIYEDKNHVQIQKLIKQIQQKQKQGETDQYQKMLNAPNLFIITYSNDAQTAAIQSNSVNNLNNRYLLDYQNQSQLEFLLNQYAKNQDNFVILIIQQQKSSQDQVLHNFMEKNKNISDFQNLIVKYKRYDLNQSLSMNSKVSNGEDLSVQRYIKAAIQDRDRYFDPFKCHANNYVYLLYRVNKAELFVKELRQIVGNSARLKKATYQDENYLEGFLKTLERGKDYAIIITDDSCLRQAQQVAKKFNKVQIMNVTNRKNIKYEIKVLTCGPIESIVEQIRKIDQKQKVQQREQYKQTKKQQYYLENSLPKRLPRNIQFKQGNNVTIKISSLETSPDSQVMQNNLHQYFNQEVRVQVYKDPKEIRLVNKDQQPLTFIICRDDPKELQYMKDIARNQKDNLRQEYIVYSQNPIPLTQTLFNQPRYERFRFISNSWKRIEDYIIGVYQGMRGYKNQLNDQIYQDQIIHLFYPPEANMRQFLQNYINNSNQKIWNNVRIYPLSDLRQIALEQSPHHLYYILVDESNFGMNMNMSNNTAIQSINNPNNANIQYTLGEIKKVQRQLEVRGVAPKRMKMLIIKKKTESMKDGYIQGYFDNPSLAMSYIANTLIRAPRYQINKPHIIIDKNSSEWLYFLRKHQNKSRYVLHYVDNIEQSIKVIQAVRNNQVAAQFLYVSSKQKDMLKFLQYTRHIEQGLRIYGVFHGQYPTGIPQNKILFYHPQRQQIESFLLNAHKRSQTIFSPESLRKKPLLAMTKYVKSRVPINQRQLAKWKQDLGAEQVILNNVGEVRNYTQDPQRNVILIVDFEQNVMLKDVKENMSNVWKIIFDSNQKYQTKAHKLLKMYPNNREMYYGYYPAEITQYLKYLRYNLKNPQEKLKTLYNNELTNLFLQKQLPIHQEQLQNLYRYNDSLAKVYNFGANGNQIQNALNFALSNPNYDNLFIVSKAGEAILNKLPYSNKVRYIVYDENFRRGQMLGSPAQLVTDQQPQYITYLNNLPEHRYRPAKQFKSFTPLKLLYQSTNSALTKQIQQLKSINKWNPNFTMQPYQNISDLRQFKQNIVVLTDYQTYLNHIRELNYLDNVRYFILGNNAEGGLYPDGKKGQFFLARENKELHGYFYNLKRNQQYKTNPIRFPTMYEPAIQELSRKNLLKQSQLLRDHNLNYRLRQLNFHQPIQPKKPIFFNQVNFFDNVHKNFFSVPYNLVQDNSNMQPENLQNYMHLITKNIQPLRLNLDRPIAIDQRSFVSRPDNLGSVPQLKKPGPKKIQRKLAIVHPENREFREIYRVLESNLSPKSFTKIQSFPYSNDFDFKNLYKNQNKFLGFDRTVIFVPNQLRKYQNDLRQIQRKMNGKAEYYFFNDDFNEKYNQFKTFLSPYTIRNQQIPYINKQQPKFWLTPKLYNILVPPNKKKRYDIFKRNNIIVNPYSCQDDIQSQLHRGQQFTIIVCEKKDYHKYKKYPRISPRCIIAIQDTQQLKQDQVPLFRYPKKVIYYGPDAGNQLSKKLIPPKPSPIKPEPMKVLFYNQKNPLQIQNAFLDHFYQYEKIPYTDYQDLFIKLMELHRENSINYRFGPNLSPNDLIKLHPKIYIQKHISYMKKLVNQPSNIHQVHEQPKFTRVIKPNQYRHLHIRQYENLRDLRQMLQPELTPCIVYIDEGYHSADKILKDFRDKHLFILFYYLLDIWINKQGYLIESEKLARQQLAVKQTLFTSMFNKDVFDAYNDMGYFYLSNAAHIQKQRNIYFMTRQALVQKFKNSPNLLMVLFVQNQDKKFIPKQFYDSNLNRLKQDRVKVIFIDGRFIHDPDILYIKFNQIDPVIYHINRVQRSSRQDFCIYPANLSVKWNQFASKHKGFTPIQYAAVGEQFRDIAENIKGKFRHVYVICQRQDQSFVRSIFDQYGIRTKKGSNQRLSFGFVTDADIRSFLSNVKPSNINFIQDNNEQKFQTEIHPMDAKPNNTNFGSNHRDSSINSPSSYNLSPNYNSNRINNSNYNTSNNNNSPNYSFTKSPLSPTTQLNQSKPRLQSPNPQSYHQSPPNPLSPRPRTQPMSIQQIVQGKNFIVNINQKLKNVFPVGNLYASKINYFRNLDANTLNQLKKQSQNQLVITNQNLNIIKNQLQNGSGNVFLVYVSDHLPSVREKNSIILKESEIPNFIQQLEKMQNGGNNIMMMNTNFSTNQYSLPEENNLKVSARPGANNQQNFHQQAQQAPNRVNKRNLSDFKVVKLFYDKQLSPQTKKQILFAAVKNQNFHPFVFTNLQALKKLIKQDENSISLLLISKDPPNLKEELQKQNFTVVKNKNGRVIMPKNMNSYIEGLETILEQDESQLAQFKKDDTPEQEVEAFLKIFQKNPENGRKYYVMKKYQSDKNNQLQNNQNVSGHPLKVGGIPQQLNQQDSDKLNLHSNINIEGNDGGGLGTLTGINNKDWLRQRLDGGIIIVFVDKNYINHVQDIRKRRNILVQEYNHHINLKNNIRQKKDKFTIVLVQSYMLPHMKSLKQHNPKSVFIYINPDKIQASPQDKQHITYQIHNIEDLQPIILEIYEENQKIKYNQNVKMNSKVGDNKRTSYVDNGNSWRLSTGYQNTRVKNAFIFLKEEKNKNLLKKLVNLHHITFVPYKDIDDAKKKLNSSYSGYQLLLIANDIDIPQFEDYVARKKQQAYLIKLNQPENHRQNPKIKKNILLSAFSQDQIANYLIEKFGQNSIAFKSNQRPKQGKSYAPRYQPNMFGTTPRFSSQKDYVPLKNDPIYSSRSTKTLSRESKVLRDGQGTISNNTNSIANTNKNINENANQNPSFNPNQNLNANIGNRNLGGNTNMNGNVNANANMNRQVSPKNVNSPYYSR